MALTGAEGRESVLSPGFVAYCLNVAAAPCMLRGVEGQDEALGQASDTGLFEVARIVPVSWDSASLNAVVFAKDAYRVCVARVGSAGATALRVRLDVSLLSPGQEIWEIDPQGGRVFGSYCARDLISGGNWLPTVGGDTVVLVGRSRSGEAPQLAVTAVAHFYRGLGAEKAGGDVDDSIACEPDPTIQQIASAYGKVVIPYDNAMIVASGALINNPATPDVLEPYFLAAVHIIPDQNAILNADVVWDYREAHCGEKLSTAMAILPRSQVVRVICQRSDLDTALLELDAVPTGAYGRTYLGWDTRTPQIGEPVIVMHHSAGEIMRLCRGAVEDLEQTVTCHDASGAPMRICHETLVAWTQGKTSPGASGACLLYAADGSYRISGTLTGNPSSRGSSSDLFSSIQQFMGSICLEGFEGAAGEMANIPAADPLASFDAAPRQGTAPLTVDFADRSRAGSRAIKTWTWEFGDGTCANGQTVRHTYTTSGVYTATLTVTSDDGSDAESAAILVSCAGCTGSMASAGLTARPFGTDARGDVLLLSLCALTLAAISQLAHHRREQYRRSNP